MMINFADYSTFTGFGDSLVDSGNADILFGFAGDPTPDDEGYVGDRFSNGANYFDRIFASITGLDALSYLPGLDFGASGNNGLNYAVGGARAVGDLAGQITAFSGDLSIDRIYPDGPDTADLFGVAIGGNDLLNFVSNDADLIFTAQEIASLASSVASAIADNIEDLVGFGAVNILVAGAPNVGVSPSIVNGSYGGDLAQSVAAIQSVVDAVNEALTAELLDIRFDTPGVEIFYFAPDFASVIADPSAFGLDASLLSTPFVDDFAAGTATLDDISLYAFMDDVHPTAAIQAEYFSQAQASELVGTAATEGDDMLIGSRGDDVITGSGGADLIMGGDGNDLLIGDGGLA